jgi:hypothetical protein
MINKLNCFAYGIMLYLSTIFYYGYSSSAELNQTLTQSLTIFIASSKLERETFKACEFGQLEEYRKWKRRTFPR